MSEDIKTPFGKARENARLFAETADMMASLSKLKGVMESIDDLTGIERETVSLVVDASIKTLSDYLEKRGHEWN